MNKDRRRLIVRAVRRALGTPEAFFEAEREIVSGNEDVLGTIASQTGFSKDEIMEALAHGRRRMMKDFGAEPDIFQD